MASSKISLQSKTERTPSLLLSLRDFEVSIIVRFLSAKEKLLTMALLSKRWHALISKHYSWEHLPSRGPNCLLSGYLDFLDKFDEFTGMRVPSLPEELFTKRWMADFEGASSVGAVQVGSEKHFKLLCEHPALLSKL